MKKVLIAVVVLVVVVVAGVFVLYSNLDSIVKAAVEDVGSKATGTEVTLNEVSLSPTSGEGALRGFTLGNPQGYKTPSAMRFGEVKVKLDVASLTGDTVTVREVVITAPEVTYELSDTGGSNIQTIQKNVEQYTGAGAKGGQAPGGGGTSGQPPAEEGGKKLIIERLRIDDGSVRVSAPMLNQDRTLKLPPVELSGIGKKTNGATAAEVAEQVIGAIAAQAQKAVATLDLNKVMDDARKALEGGGGKQLEEQRKKLEEGLKGLMGK